jgi:predicted SAM-dependent methyltransferase
MTVVALETRDLAVRNLAALPSPTDYFYPLSASTEQPLQCRFITTYHNYDSTGLPLPLVRVVRAIQMLRYLWDCYSRCSTIDDAREIHICSLLAYLPIWWWQVRQVRRRLVILYARRTELAALTRGPRLALAKFALRHADAVVVENVELKDYVCQRLNARHERVHTVSGLVQEPLKSPMAVMYMHPERRALFDVCHGRGIDVGCGSNKTHPLAIGVDLTPKGASGRYGNQRLQISEADVVSEGDNLTAFPDESMDYVVERHNLEHYLDPVKAIQELHRVLRPAGVLGMVVPDDAAVDTIQLDPTHKHAFTMDSLARLIKAIGGFQIITNRVCIPGWSFVLIAQKLSPS